MAFSSLRLDGAFGKKIKSVEPIMRWAQQHLKTPENIEKVQNTIAALKISQGLCS